MAIRVIGNRKRCGSARGTGAEQTAVADSLQEMFSERDGTVARRMADVDGREWSCGKHLCTCGTGTRTSWWGTVVLACASVQLVAAAGVVLENGCVFAYGESQQSAIVRPSRRLEPVACNADLGEGHADQQQHCWRDRRLT